MKLIIPAAIERKLNAYVQAVDGEIAGMGKIEMRDDGNLWVMDLAIYDQEVTAGTADLDSASLAMFQTELIRKGESPKDWYLWWHSHNNFSSFFSKTDTDTMDSSTEFDHLVSLVVNKKRERKCRLDTHRPFRLTIPEVNVEVAPLVTARSMEIEAQISELMDQLALETESIPGGLEAVETEVAAKVRVKKYPAYTGYSGNGASFGKQGRRDESYFNESFNEDWSKKRKKDGGVTTSKEIIEKVYGVDELELMIEQTESIVNAHIANGNADTPECEQLQADLADYYDALLELQPERGEKPDDKDYWDGREWRSYEEYNEEQEHLPALPAPYKYGFQS